MKENMRAYTSEEVRTKFLCMIRSSVLYWASRPNISDEEKCDGVAFSILNILDGTSEFPPLNISIASDELDMEDRIDNGDNWFTPDMLINDCLLHDEYYKVNK